MRVRLQGRAVGGWVEAIDVPPESGLELADLRRHSGWGPPGTVLELARWAARRWVGPVATVLRSASPERVVRALPSAPPRRSPPSAIDGAAIDGGATASDGPFTKPVEVVQVAPASDRMHLVRAACARGPALIVLPDAASAAALANRLEREGVPVARHPWEWARARAGGHTVVGPRSAVWAPMPALDAVLVLDEHDEGHKQEQTPSWHARDVAVERGRRAGAPVVLASPCPTLEAAALAEPQRPDRSSERAGWPLVEVVDQRQAEPGRALFGDAVVRELQAGRRVGCVLNRTGRIRLLACRHCEAVTRCERCDAVVGEEADGVLTCRRCGDERPLVCQECGRSGLRALRLGVGRATDELAALARRPVVAVTAETTDDALSDADDAVFVGTEALLHRIRDLDTVAFLDFDQELLAPRYRAAEQALGLLARAGRIVGRRDGRIIVQTRQPEHEVVRAAMRADPGIVREAEEQRRRDLEFPPFTVMAAVSGQAADAYIDGLDRGAVDVLGPRGGGYLVRAPDHPALSATLAAAERPAGRLRIDVDPLRV